MGENEVDTILRDNLLIDAESTLVFVEGLHFLEVLLEQHHRWS